MLLFLRRLNNNLGNLVAGSPVIADCNGDLKTRGMSIVRWDGETLNTPYKAGISTAAEGTIIDAGMPQFRTQISIGYSAEVLFIRRYTYGTGWNDWNKIPTNADLNNTLKIANSANTYCYIKFISNTNDKCLLEFVGNNNGQYLYLALSVIFSNGAITQVAVIKKEATTDVNAILENGNIKISGLAAYGVFEARTPKGFNIQSI